MGLKSRMVEREDEMREIKRGNGCEDVQKVRICWFKKWNAREGGNKLKGEN